MSDLFWLTDEQIERLRPFFSKEPWEATGGRSAGAERHRVRQQERSALARCAERLRPAQDAIQSVEALGRGRCDHTHDGGVGDCKRGARNGHDRRDLDEGAPHKAVQLANEIWI